MERFSEDSGGRAFQAHKLTDLPDLAIRVSRLMHGQYVLGFSPASLTRDGKYHTIRVQVASPDRIRVHADWRRGYYAPVQ
jgi:VWFA-related protein